MATDLASSHHDWVLTIFFRPFMGLSRLKSGASFFVVGLKPTWATFTRMTITIMPTSIGATTPIAFHIASAAKRLAPP